MDTVTQAPAADGPATKTCPECAATLTVNRDFVTWCERCDWNLEPSGAKQLSSKEVRRREAAKRRGEELFKRLGQRPLDRPRGSGARRGSLAIALLVHAITLCLFALGLVVIITGAPHVSSIAIGVGLMLLALLLRPHFGRLGRRDIMVSRYQAPTLHQLTGAVAKELGAEPPSIIVITGDFNAGHGRIGLRRRPVLWIGLALWDILDDRERVALLGHEFGHQVNGDPARGFWVQSALRTLRDWYLLLPPGFRWKRVRSVFDLVELLASGAAIAVMRLLALGIVALYRLELELLFRSSQEAEYYADALAARVASASAAASCMDQLHLAKVCTMVIDFAAQRGKEDLWVAEREFLATLPPKEVERLRRIDARHGTAIDSTHPPTGLRVALLQKSEAHHATIQLSADDSAKIAVELEDARSEVAERIRARVAARVR